MGALTTVLVLLILGAILVSALTGSRRGSPPIRHRSASWADSGGTAGMIDNTGGDHASDCGGSDGGGGCGGD